MAVNSEEGAGQRQDVMGWVLEETVVFISVSPWIRRMNGFRNLKGAGTKRWRTFELKGRGKTLGEHE